MWAWNLALILKESHRSGMYENKVLRTIFIPKKSVIIEDEKLHNEGLYNVYS
jgi:hypothetical protein